MITDTSTRSVSRRWRVALTTLALTVLLVTAVRLAPLGAADGAALQAGVAKVDITNTEAGPVNDPLYVKALVVKDARTTAVIITVDAVAIANIGSIRDPYLANVRAALKRELGIEPRNVVINASHCHGIVCADVEQRTVQAVKSAVAALVPVHVGAGTGHEDRVQENRRLKLKDGREADVRHAYSLPPDEAVVGAGPIDPEIGILRLDRKDGRPLAVVYNFAVHPIQGVPNGGNTADLTGFASRVIEDSLGEGAMALFLQGCGGDINPMLYKDVAHPRDAEPIGNTLGLSTMRAARKVKTQDRAALRVVNEVIQLPRADFTQRIQSLEAEQARLLKSLTGTSLNFKTFVELLLKHGLSDEFPSYYSHRYLHDQKLGREPFKKLDADNRANVKQYLKNVHTMEELTKVQTNLALLRMHQAQNTAAGAKTMDVELVGLRIGEFVLMTFPGELTAQIGLNIKKSSPHALTFVAGYSNGYIYYAPTEEQLANTGCAQEDCDTLLGAGWQTLFERKAAEMLAKL
ncbi:MAG: hypothetical protein ACO1SX_10445 [Actinomycetota bacterium]